MNIKSIAVAMATTAAFLFVISKTPLAPMVGLNRTGGFGF